MSNLSLPVSLMSSLMRCSRPLACTNKRLYKAQWDQIAKIRQELDQQKLVKLIDVSNACNSLTKFCIWSEWNDRKRKLCQSAETCLEKFMKSLQVNLFLADFIHLGPLCRKGRGKEMALATPMSVLQLSNLHILQMWKQTKTRNM